jgi:hypothetical protein
MSVAYAQERRDIDATNDAPSQATRSGKPQPA